MIAIADIQAYVGNSDADSVPVLTDLEERAVEVISNLTGRYWGDVEAAHVYLGAIVRDSFSGR